MSLYAITCFDKPDSTALRNDARPAHMDYLNSRSDVIVLAGALMTEDGQTMIGSQFIINVPDRAAAEKFAAGDPFTGAGLFASTTINRMRKGFWFPEVADGA